MQRASGATLICGECGGGTSRLRRGRCNACYMRLYRSGEVPGSASCCVCGERRRAVLAMAELEERAVVLCGNCTLVLVRTRPRIATLDELSKRVARERRDFPERRRIIAPIEPDRRLAFRRTVDKGVREDPAPQQRPFDPSID